MTFKIYFTVRVSTTGASTAGTTHACIWHIIINYIYCTSHRLANAPLKNSPFTSLEDNLISEICKR